VGSWLCTLCSLHLRTLSDLCHAAVPPFGALCVTPERLQKYFKLSCVVLCWHVVPKLFCLVQHVLSKNLLSVLIFILLYCIISSSGLLGVFPASTGDGLGHGSGSELPGEYGYVFMLKSGFTGHMWFIRVDHAMAVSCVHVHPISGVACVKTPCEATNRVSQIIFSLMALIFLFFVL